MIHPSPITNEVSEAISYLISNAIESGCGREWFSHRNYDWEDRETGFYAEVELKMDSGCCPNWAAPESKGWVKVTPQAVKDRMELLLSMPNLGFHSQSFWDNDRGYLAQQMRNLLAGDYGDGDGERDDGIMQVLFCGEVVCS